MSDAIRFEVADFVVRTVRQEDITQRVVEWFDNDEVYTGLNIAPLHLDLPRFRGFISLFNNVERYFVGIFVENDSVLVGFFTIDVMVLHRTATLTAVVGEPSYKGKNILRTTCEPLVDYLYANKGIEKVVARVASDNWRMLYNFRNTDRFYLEGVLEQECRTPDGRRIDMLSFASLKNPPSGKQSLRPGVPLR